MILPGRGRSIMNKFEVVRSRTISRLLLPTTVSSAMSTSTTVRQRTTRSTEKENLIKITNEGEQRDKELDRHDTYGLRVLSAFFVSSHDAPQL